MLLHTMFLRTCHLFLKTSAAEQFTADLDDHKSKRMEVEKIAQEKIDLSLKGSKCPIIDYVTFDEH